MLVTAFQTASKALQRALAEASRHQDEQLWGRAEIRVK
jgi:hypothetical protein